MPVGNRRFKDRDYYNYSLVERRGGVQRFRWYDGVWQRIESLDDLIWHHLTDMGFITPIREILRMLPTILIGVGVAYLIGVATGAMVFRVPDLE